MPHQTHKYSHTQPHSFAYVNWLTHINTPTSAYRCISMHLIVLKAPHSYDVVYVPGWISLSFLLSIITSILSIWVPEEKKRNVYMCVHACVRACVREKETEERRVKVIRHKKAHASNRSKWDNDERDIYVTMTKSTLLCWHCYLTLWEELKIDWKG